METNQLKNELSATLAKLEAERDAILAEVAPLQAQRAALVAQIQPLEADLRAVNAQIKAVEQPRIAEVGRQIAALHRAMGATSLKATG